MIRHKVDPVLQKRIRFVIKAWQKLLSPNFTANSVIPLKCADLAASTTASPRTVSKPQHSNGTPIKSALSDKPNSAHTVPASVDSPRTSESRGLKRSYLSASNLTTLPPKARDSNNDNTYPSDSPLTNQQAATPNKRLRYQQQPVASPQVKPATTTPMQVESQSSPKPPMVNGGRHIDTHSDWMPISKPSTPVLTKSNTIVGSLRSSSTNSPQLPSRDGRTTQAARLAKVKSTAELVQAAGDCIDSATADRILTNRINKEADPPRPSIVSQLTRTRQPRNASGSAQGAQNETPKSRSNTPRLARSSSLRADTPARSTPLGSDCRSELVNHTNRPSDRATPPVSALLGTNRLTADTSASPGLGHSVDHKAETIKRPALSESEPGVADTDSDSQRSRHKKHKKHHKHRHKHHNDGTDSGRPHKHGRSPAKIVLPPITNHMDDWPQLPPLPTEIDWYSLDRPIEGPTVSSSGTTDAVTRLLYEPWPEVNRTVDDQGLLHLPTELYSLSLDDQYLHILPWVDIFGHRRQFFPSEDDLEQLTVLPDPW
ncbi:unnamed protein product [Echinostoma caproni]|uniref:Mediator of RNA polymerase II transcription subunit 26 n=1 Tax=Echinostoma caproni TaxID=27848 RepID=A0A183AXK0_9TREM|nr:unnamed protein product [Echinostoma caproni]